MNKALRIVLIIAGILLVMCAVLWFNRRFWVARIRSKWADRFPWVFDEPAFAPTASFWDTLTLKELRSIAWSGLNSWFQEEQERQGGGEFSGEHSAPLVKNRKA